MKKRIKQASYVASGAFLVWACALSLHALPSPAAHAAIQDQGGGQEEAKPKPKSNTPEEKPANQQETRPKGQQARPGENVRPEEKATRTQENRTAQEPRTSQESPNRQVPSRTQAAGRRGGQPQAHPSYQFRSQDVSRLRQYYRTKITSVSRTNRVQISEGGYVPQTVVTYIQPVPVEVVQVLPPPPPGYLIGFYDGYVIVYDPNTLFVVTVIDLL